MLEFVKTATPLYPWRECGKEKNASYGPGRAIGRVIFVRVVLISVSLGAMGVNGCAYSAEQWRDLTLEANYFGAEFLEDPF